MFIKMRTGFQQEASIGFLLKRKFRSTRWHLSRGRLDEGGAAMAEDAVETMVVEEDEAER